MKVLIVDTDGVGLSFAWRCAIAGHQVRWFVKPRPANHLEAGRGFRGVDRIGNWIPSVKWADLILPTSNDDYVERLAFFKKQGYPVFGPSVESVKLEVSRAAGMKALEAAGIECVPYEQFKNVKEAYDHVKKTEERYVFKTLGDNEDKSLTYVSKHAADLMGWMDKRMKDTNIKGAVMLQTFIEGIEMGVSRWMGKDGWVGQWNESFEHKKLMSGNHGPNTGEMGTVAAFTKESKLGEETLSKLESALIKFGHLGDTALGFMIDEKGKPWPTEWTCRCGWPIFNMMLAANKGDPVQWMKDAVEGKDTTEFSEEIGTCVVIAQPPFPNGDGKPEELAGTPIYGVTKGNKYYIHPVGVKIDMMPDMDSGGKVIEKPLWNTAGDYNMVVTGFGKDIKQSRDRAYKTVGQLHLANMIVRDDIGEELEETLPKLHKMGYATHFNYQENK